MIHNSSQIVAQSNAKRHASLQIPTALDQHTGCLLSETDETHSLKSSRGFKTQRHGDHRESVRNKTPWPLCFYLPSEPRREDAKSFLAIHELPYSIRLPYLNHVRFCMMIIACPRESGVAELKFSLVAESSL